MQLLSNKTDKDDTNVITVTKKIGELQFEDEEEDSFFTKVIFLRIFVYYNPQDELILELYKIKSIGNRRNLILFMFFFIYYNVSMV